MKKIIVSCTVLAMFLAITACSSCKHENVGEYQADPTNHWKVCKDCNEEVQKAEHTLDQDNKCSVCNSEIYEWTDTISVYTYDSHNNVTRLAEFEMDGRFICDNVYVNTYDEQGCLTKVEEYEDGRYVSLSEYKVVDGESLITKYTYHNEEGSKAVNEYDDYGNVIRLLSYDAEGTIEHTVDYVFVEDENGEWYNESAVENYADGTKIECAYNTYGEATSIVTYDAEGMVTCNQRWDYTYDEDGFTASEKEYLDEVLITEKIYKIFEDDEFKMSYPETIINYHEDGGKTVYVYNELDELISTTHYDADGNVNE